MIHLRRILHLLIYLIVADFLLGKVAASADFDQCIEDIRKGTYGKEGGTDNFGIPITDISSATSITFELCVKACGSGPEAFKWSVFSSQFSAWLLPYLSLISQLPFGSKLKWDNLISMLLTVGSPTLAAYSLIMTVLNGQWVAHRFGSHSYPNNDAAIRIMRSLQQSSVKISTERALLASLVVLPQNDDWWEEFYNALNYTHTWSISASTSIAWVGIAYVFTLVDSFTSISNNINTNGQGVGSSWLWLLPIVIGWLQISPKCDMDRLTAAFTRANRIAHVVSPTGLVKADEVSGEHAFMLQRYRDSAMFCDEECSAPIFNYARVFSWAQAVEEVAAAFRQASRNASDHIPVDTSRDWVPATKSGEVKKANRLGTIDQVINYCRPPRYTQLLRSRWGPNVFSRMFVASAFALALQWGTTCAAVIVVIFTPTKGLGCRSGGYILYGVISTIVWMLMVSSSMLAHYSTIPSHHSMRTLNKSQRTATVLSMIFRRTGKTLATLNAIWIVVSCLFQFSNFYNRCYCNSSVLGLGDRAYDVITLLPTDLSKIRAAWTGAAVLSGSIAVLFVGFVRLYMDLEPAS